MTVLAYPSVRTSVSFQMPQQSCVAPAAIQLEQAGLDGLWTTELPSRDAILRAFDAAAHTEQVTVGTGIAYTFTRHPLAAATLAAEAHVSSGGRFRLGLGTGHRAHWSWYGVDYDRPAARLEEYVTVLRGAFEAQGHFTHAGEFYRIDCPIYRLSELQQLGSRPELIGSGLSPAMLRAIGRSCDGILLHPLALIGNYLDDVALPAIAGGRGDDSRPFSLVASIITAVDEDEAVAHRKVRRQLGFYLSQPGFDVAVRGSRWEAHVAELRAAVSNNGFVGLDDAARALPEALVAECTISGTPKIVSERAEEWNNRLAARGFSEACFAPIYDELTDKQTIDMITQLTRALAVARQS